MASRTQSELNTLIAQNSVVDRGMTSDLLQDIIDTMFDPTSEVSYDDDVQLSFGTSDDASFTWSTGDASNHALVLGLGDLNTVLHLAALADIATDWILTAETEPALYIHSTTTPATDYLKIGVHSGTACWIGDMFGTAVGHIGFDGLEVLSFAETASAVNHVDITNAATAGAPSIKATGGDTNVTLELGPKGTTGVVQVTGPLVDKTTQTAETDTGTITIATLLTKVIDGTPTSAATYTLPTAALLVAGIIDAKVGDSFEFVINNKSGGANTITVAAGSGGTADGTLTVAQNVVRAFKIIITNVTGASEAYFAYGIG